MNSRIELKNVHVAFQMSGTKSAQIHAANNINLRINSGDRVGVIGRNGSGKSTLLKIVSGNLMPHSGSVDVRGEMLALINRGVGLIPKATLVENARVKAYEFGLKGNSVDHFIAKVLEDAKLVQRAGSDLTNLSTGMTGRFNIALNSQMVKQITIFDEWIGTLDVSGDGENSILNRVVQEASILMLASHNDKLIRKLCNKALLMEQGSIVYYGNDFKLAFRTLKRIKQINDDGRYSVKELSSLLGFALGSQWDSNAFAGSNLIESTQNLQNEIGLLNFVDTGRASVQAISKWSEKSSQDAVVPIFHNPGVRVHDIQSSKSICVLYRRPEDSFVSAFYCRKLEGQPDNFEPWTDFEKNFFAMFGDPSAVLLALRSENEPVRILAKEGLNKIDLINRGLKWHFGAKWRESSIISQIRFALNVNDLKSAAMKLQRKGFSGEPELLRDVAEEMIQKVAKPLSAPAREIFTQQFSEEIEIYNFLENLHPELS